jgi:Zn-dependent protease
MSPEKIFQIAVEVVVLLFAVSFHESAHGYVAMKCGDNTARDLGRITMNPLKHIDPFGSILLPLMLAIAGLPIFGWARPVPISLQGLPNPRKANLLISAAGPLSNFILAAAFTGVVMLVRPYVHDSDPASVMHPLLLVAVLSVLINIALGVFNLFPIPPLDGFGVLESLMPASFYPVAQWLRRYGIVIFILAIYSGVIGKVMGPAQASVFNWLLGRSS